MTKEQMHERSEALLAFAIQQATGSEDEEAECDGREVIAILDTARFVMMLQLANSGGIGDFFLGEAGDWSGLSEPEAVNVE